MYYYIMVDPDKPNTCKLGITKNPKQRLRAYTTAAPSCYFLKTYPTFEKYHEKRILDVFRCIARVQREFVHFHPEIAKNVVEAYFDDNQIDYVQD